MIADIVYNLDAILLDVCVNHRYLIYTRWCIPHCGQAKIEARSFNTQMEKSIVFSVGFFDEWDRPIWPTPIVMREYRSDFWLHFLYTVALSSVYEISMVLTCIEFGFVASCS